MGGLSIGMADNKQSKPKRYIRCIRMSDRERLMFEKSIVKRCAG